MYAVHIFQFNNIVSHFIRDIKLNKSSKATIDIFDISQNRLFQFLGKFAVVKNNFSKCILIYNRIGRQYFRYSILIIRSEIL